MGPVGDETVARDDSVSHPDTFLDGSSNHDTPSDAYDQRLSAAPATTVLVLNFDQGPGGATA